METQTIEYKQQWSDKMPRNSNDRLNDQVNPLQLTENEEKGFT